MMNYKYVIKEDCNKYLTELLYKMKIMIYSFSLLHLCIFSGTYITLSLFLAFSLVSQSVFTVKSYI